MQIKYLHVHNFRNLKEVQLDFKSKINFIVGGNGSGKTSLLESIYYLSCGKSFRSKNKRLINFDSDNFILFCNIEDGINKNKLGVRLSTDGTSVYKVNGEENKKQLDLTSRLPILFIGPETISLVTDGPEIRRSFLDWGLFYQNSEFFKIWAHFRNALNQRNSALKQKLSERQILEWDKFYVENAVRITQLRKEYFAQILPVFKDIYSQFFSDLEISIKYQQGWLENSDLLDLLKQNIERDLEFGFTRSGPHRADLDIRYNSVNVNDVLSRGQLKLIACSLKLAQGSLLDNIIGNKCIYLVDDISSELDKDKQKQFSKYLVDRGHQSFVTAVSSNIVNNFLSQDFIIDKDDYRIINLLDYI